MSKDSAATAWHLHLANGEIGGTLIGRGRTAVALSEADSQDDELAARIGSPRVRAWPIALCSAFAVIYSVFSITQFSSYNTPSWDNAIFEQAVASYSHLHAPIANIKGPGFDLLGDHFSPILAVLAPFYRIYPHAQTILIAQCMLIASSIYPIAQLAIRYAGKAAGVAIAVCYGMSFGVQTALHAEFHEVAFATPLLAFAGAAYVDRRWNHVVAWALPLVLVKEDLGLTVAFIGVALALAGAMRRGLVLMIAGICASALSILVIIPAINPDGEYPYGQGVDNAGGFLSTVAGAITAGGSTKLVTVLLTFGITGFLALRSPWVLVVVPNLASRFLVDNSSYWSTYFHYSLIPMTIVFVAMIDAIRRAPAQRPAWWRAYASHAPAAAVAAALVLWMHFPFWVLTQADTYEQTDKARAGAEAVALIPAGATVETDTGLVTHVVSQHDVYWFGDMGDVVPDYVLLDKNSGHDVDIVAWAEAQFPGSSYRQLYDAGGYLLAVRVR